MIGNETKKSNAILSALLGTIVEYYDYGLYAFAASIIADKFFASGNAIENLTSVFAVYACAYIGKPLGSLIFGILGDHFGRKYALSITMIGIAIPTVIIGLLPEYSVFGIYSTIILIICRFMQSIFVAGEYDGAAIYVIEHLGDKYKYTASSIVRTTGAFGMIAAIVSISVFSSDAFPTWGWRIPFLLSFPFGVITILYRRTLDETPDFQSTKDKDTYADSYTFMSIIKTHWMKIAAIVMLSGGFGVTYQISTIFMQQYLLIILPEIKHLINKLSILLVLCFTFSMPISGILADKIGKMFVIRIYTIIALFGAYTLYLSVLWHDMNLAIMGSIVLAICVAPYNALGHSAVIGAFPVKARYRAISLGHTIGSVLMSGSANYICLKFIASGILVGPVLYITSFIVISYLSFSFFSR